MEMEDAHLSKPTEMQSNSELFTTLHNQSQSPHQQQQQQQQQHANNHVKLQQIDETSAINIPHVASLSSVSSASTFASTTGNQQNTEIYENINDDNLNDHDMEIHSNLSFSSNHSFLNGNFTPNQIMTPINITPSPHSKHSNHNFSPSASPKNLNDDEDNDKNDEFPLSPTITALTKLYTDNINNDDRNISKSSPSIDHENENEDGTETEIEFEPHPQHHQDRKSHLFLHQKSKNKSASSSSSSTSSSISSYLWSFVPYSNNNNTANENENECKEDEQSASAMNDHNLHKFDKSFHRIMQNPQFIDNTIQIYGKLDNALKNIKRRKTALRSKRKIHDENQLNDDDDHDCKNSKLCDDREDDINNEVLGIMRTLISSTTTMSNFFDDNSSNNHDEKSSLSLIGSTLNRISSSFSYVTWISVGRLTPYLYNMMEVCLLEIYSTIKDIVEYYDPDPKSNILLQIIDKMTEIIEAIRGLLALSDCFYEISSDHEHDENGENDDDDANNNHFNHNSSSSYSYMHHFTNHINTKKQKKD